MKKKKLRKELNPQQFKVVTAGKGNYLIVAGAGSGKTHSLTNRVAYLIGKGVDPSDILLLTFTNKAAREMLERAGKLARLDDDFKVEGGTFHSFALKIMYKYVSRIEPRLKKFNVIDSSDSKNVLKMLMRGKQRYSAYGFPKYKDVHSKYSYAINTNSSMREVFNDSKHLEQLARLLKEFTEYKLANGMVDFDDLLFYLLKILENDKLRTRISRRFRYILVDESQDMNVLQINILKHISSHHKNVMCTGDVSQCWSGDSKVKTSKGVKQIKELNIGDEVRCVVKGNIDYKPITNMSKHEDMPTLVIKTESGKRNIVTPNHKFFTTEPEFDGSWYVYLMYRKSKGFRLGILSGGSKNTIGTRTSSEGCDFLWIVKKCKNESVASYYESMYSLKYNIPKNPFHCYGRDLRLTQKHLDKIFKRFGENGFKLLRDLNYSFDYPNYISQGNSCKGNIERTIINLNFNQCDDRNYHIVVRFESKVKQIKKVKYFNNYVSALDYAIKMKEKYKADIIYEKFRMPKYSVGGQAKFLNVVFANQLTEGMRIPILKEGKLILDKINSIEKFKTKTVHDIEVAEAGNLVVGGIVSHNSVYAFRGSDPLHMLWFIENFENVKIFRLEQNYRSTESIVSMANTIPLNHDERLNKTLFTENKKGASPFYYMALDDGDEAMFVCDKIMESFENGNSLDSNAVIFRAGFHSNILEMELHRNNIKFVKYGGFRFLELSHIKDLIALIKVCLFPKTDTMSWIRTLSNISGIGQKTLEIILNEVLVKRKGYFGLKNFSKTKFGDDLKDLYLMIKRARRGKPTPKIFDIIMPYYDKVFIKLYGEYRGSTKDYKTVKRRKDVESLLYASAGYKSIKKFINDITLEPKEEKEKAKDAVVLSTVHSIKGLEYDNVYIIHCKEEFFPSKYATTAKAIEEERRLFYVACTRAKDTLTVISTLGRESKFVRELRGKNIFNEVRSVMASEHNTC